jgi:hypothetical protein
MKSSEDSNDTTCTARRYRHGRRNQVAAYICVHEPYFSDRATRTSAGGCGGWSRTSHMRSVNARIKQDMDYPRVLGTIAVRAHVRNDHSNEYVHLPYVRMAILPTGTGIRGYRTRMDRVWVHFHAHE